jgi:EAL domain-containing protein (putative c-di-GMP-specific phosphodiesterase class I)
VLNSVLEELRRNPSVKFGVNLSNSTIQNGEWLSMALTLIENSGVASRLTLEITETVEQRDTKKVIRFVTSMQELGCSIALDDFGAGFTSLAQLKHLPVDVIKIDGSYVRDIVYNPESRLFVKTLLDFSRNFGLKTIAEFVENVEIANLLTEMGVDYMQGNYFSPATAKRSWIEEKS